MRRLAATILTLGIALGATTPADAAKAKGGAVMLCAKRTPSKTGDRFTTPKRVTRPRQCATWRTATDTSPNQVDLTRIKWSGWNRRRAHGTAMLRPVQGEYNEATGRLTWPTQRVSVNAYAAKKEGRRVIFTRLMVRYADGFQREYRLPTR